MGDRFPPTASDRLRFVRSLRKRLCLSYSNRSSRSSPMGQQHGCLRLSGSFRFGIREAVIGRALDHTPGNFGNSPMATFANSRSIVRSRRLRRCFRAVQHKPASFYKRSRLAVNSHWEQGTCLRRKYALGAHGQRPSIALTKRACVRARSQTLSSHKNDGPLRVDALLP